MGDLQLVDIETGIFSSTNISSLLDLYGQEKLALAAGDSKTSKSRNDEYKSEPVWTMSDNDQIRVSLKLEFLKEMERRRFQGWHHSSPTNGDSAQRSSSFFEIALAETSAMLGFSRKVSKSSYYAWKSKFEFHDDSAALRSQYRGHSQIDRRARELIKRTMHEIVENARSASPKKPVAPMKFGQIEQACRHAIEAENNRNRARLQFYEAGRNDEDVSPIAAPKSRTTYWQYWNRLPAYDRSLVEKGPSETRAAYRGGRGAPREEAVLDRVEYDESQLPIMVFDEGTGICLGRPWLSWFIDALSGLPVGIYLGFEQVSDRSIVSALRSTCLPKSYLQSEFRIKDPYPVCGIPRLTTFDNPLSQHGRTIEAISRDLQCDHQFAPVVTGWFKGHVEGMFRTLNAGLLQDLPGFVLKGANQREYDPTRHGCLGLRALLELVWAWTVHQHANTKHPRFNESRIDVWNASSAKIPPALLTRQEHADLVFTVVRPGKLTSAISHSGIEFEGLRYYSEDVDTLRRRDGAKGNVWVRIHPDNLEYVMFAFRPSGPWGRAWSVDQSYTHNLSLHQHKIIRSAARNMSGEATIERLLEGRAYLRELSETTIREAKSLLTVSRICKMIGLGSDALTNRVRVDGTLNPPSAPPAFLPDHHSQHEPTEPRQVTGKLPTPRDLNTDVDDDELPVFSSSLTL